MILVKKFTALTLSLSKKDLKLLLSKKYRILNRTRNRKWNRDAILQRRMPRARIPPDPFCFPYRLLSLVPPIVSLSLVPRLLLLFYPLLRASVLILYYSSTESCFQLYSEFLDSNILREMSICLVLQRITVVYSNTTCIESTRFASFYCYWIKKLSALTSFELAQHL